MGYSACACALLCQVLFLPLPAPQWEIKLPDLEWHLWPLGWPAMAAPFVNAAAAVDALSASANLKMSVSQSLVVLHLSILLEYSVHGNAWLESHAESFTKLY